MTTVKIYGADWCHMTQDTLAHLRELGVEHDYINIEKDPRAREWVKRHNGGKEKKPTLDIDGRIVTEPSNRELDRILAEAGKLPQPR